MNNSFMHLHMKTPVLHYIQTEAVTRRAIKLEKLLATPFEGSAFCAKDLAPTVAAHLLGNPAQQFGALSAVGDFLLHSGRQQPNVAMTKLPVALHVKNRNKAVQQARASLRSACQATSTITPLAKNLSDMYLYSQLIARHACLPINERSIAGYFVVESNSHVHDCFSFMEICEQILVLLDTAGKENPTDENKISMLVSLHDLVQKLIPLWTEIVPYVWETQQHVTPHLGHLFCRWFHVPRTQFNKVLMVKLIKEIRQFYDKEPAAYSECMQDGIPMLLALNQKARQQAAWQIWLRSLSNSAPQ